MVGLAQESIASLGPMCRALTPVCNPPRGGGRWYAGCGFGFVIGIGIFKWSLSPSAPCHYCGSFGLCFEHFGRCRRERAGSCQSQQDKYACCKAILGVSLLSDPAVVVQFPRWDVACRKCAKVKSTVGHVLQGAASVESFYPPQTGQRSLQQNPATTYLGW